MILVICIDENGKEHKKEFFHVFAKATGWHHSLDRLSEIMPCNPVKVLDAESYLFDAKELWNIVEKALSKDPYCLAKRIDV